MNIHRSQNFKIRKAAGIVAFLLCVLGPFIGSGFVYADEEAEELFVDEDELSCSNPEKYSEDELFEGYAKSVMYADFSQEQLSRMEMAEEEMQQLEADDTCLQQAEHEEGLMLQRRMLPVFAAPAPQPSRLYESLNDYQKAIYDALIKQIEEVAEGSRTHTEFTIYFDEALALENGAEPVLLPQNEFLYTQLNAEDAQTAYANFKAEYISFAQLYDALLYNNPYALYWHDKVKGGTYTSAVYDVKSQEKIKVKSITVKLIVSENYSNGVLTGDKYYDTDSQLTGAVKKAVETASGVVAANADKEDYYKLCAYRDYICEQVSYNRNVTESSPYGNPWQLIYVFDGDPSTNVVCEGYAKAFKYLCDLSTFNSPDIVCILMGGRMAGIGGSGGHMWNIVRMDDGASYLVDITNSDGGLSWAGELFLNGYKEKKADSSYEPLCSDYYYSYSRSYSSIRYYGFSKLENYYGDSSLLKLSSHDYVPEHIHNYVDGYCAECDKYENGVYTYMKGYSLTVGSSPVMNIYMAEDDLYYGNSDNYIEFIKPDGTSKRVKTVDAVRKGHDYVFSFEVPAYGMADTITANVCKAEGSRCVAAEGDKRGQLLQYEVSVRDYADRLIKGGCNSSVEKYINSLLLYGGALQKYQGYGTDSPADSGITVKGAGIKSVSDKSMMAGINKRPVIIRYADKDSHPVSYKALKMVFADGKPQLRVYFDCVDGEDYSANVSGAPVGIKSDAYGCYVEVGNIVPYNFSKQFVVSVVDSTGAETVNVTAGIYNCISMVLKGEIEADASMKELCRRMYYLGRYGRYE